MSKAKLTASTLYPPDTPWSIRPLLYSVLETAFGKAEILCEEGVKARRNEEGKEQRRRERTSVTKILRRTLLQYLDSCYCMVATA